MISITCISSSILDNATIKCLVVVMARPRLCTHQETGRCNICYRAWYQKKVATDPEFAARRNAGSIKWARDNKEARAAIAKRRNQKAYANDPLKIIARKCIGQQVRRGNRPAARELKCEKCGEQAKHYHHYLGYAPEHRYDVIPLCVTCHNLEPE